MERVRRGPVRAIGLGVVLGLFGVMTACAAATPGCDAAVGDMEAGRLAAAAEGYARADQQGEGDCADAGGRAVASRYTGSYGNVAQARAAEAAGDRDGAVAAYRAALGADQDNDTARDGLARLGQEVQGPQLPSAQPQRPQVQPATPAPTPAAAWPRWIVWPLAVTLLLLGTITVLLLRLVSLSRQVRTAGASLGSLVQSLHEESSAAASEAEARKAETVERVAARFVVDLEENASVRASEQDRLIDSLRADLVKRIDLVANAAATKDDVGSVRGHLEELRQDLEQVVAFLDDRLPDPGPSHDGFGAPPTGASAPA